MKPFLRFLLLVQGMWFFNSVIIFPQWHQQVVPAGINSLSSISLVGLHGISGGKNTILYTTDGGSNWLTSTHPYNNGNIRIVQMINDSIGYACGTVNSTDDGIFLKTSDGGASWFNLSSLPEWVIDVHNLFFLNEDVGFITIDSSYVARGGLLKTTDGGLTWNKKLMFSSYMYLDKIVFGNSLTGFVSGDGAGKILMKTTDAGESWHLNYTIGAELLYDLTSQDENNYYFTTETASGNPLSKAYKTSNGGNTWFVMMESQTHYFVKVKFANKVGFLMGKLPYTNVNIDLFRSTNGGDSWFDPIRCPFYLVGGTYMVSDSKWFVTSYGSDNSIYLTTNGGTPVELTSFKADVNSGDVILKWSTSTETNNKGFEVERSFNNAEQFSNIGYLSGNGTTTIQHNYSFNDKIIKSGKYFYRLKQIDFDGKTEYSKAIEVNTTAVNFSLSQNYPNPFNPTTQINYSISKTGFVSIKIFNILGKEITLLVNEIKEPGSYELTFDATLLPSGIYFYRIESGSYKEIKKMTFLR